MRRRAFPYASAVAGDRALAELQKTLARFGCESFGTMIDVERGITLVQFKWRSRAVSLEASWKGYAQALLDADGAGKVWSQKVTQEAIAQARVSVCSVLRDWVKGQVTAVECGIMSFETAFMPHMLLGNGMRVIDKIRADKLLSPPS